MPPPVSLLGGRSDFHGRWLTAGEALVAQAFPINASMSFGIPCCSFAEWESNSSRTCRIGQAGNAMHCMICGIALLYAINEVPLSNTRSVAGSSLQGLVRRLRAQSRD